MKTATVTVKRNRPTRTADYGPAPEGHTNHGRRIGTGKARRPARWTRQLRSGSTFTVEGPELEALAAWLKANPTAARDVSIRPVPVARVAPVAAPAPAKVSKPAKASRKPTKAPSASGRG